MRRIKDEKKLLKEIAAKGGVLAVPVFADGVERMGFETNNPFRRKFGNIHTEYGGQIFKSKLEASFARMLDGWKQLGIITNWQYERQKYVFDNPPKLPSRKRVEYWPDFYVPEYEGSQWYFETKGAVENYDLVKWEMFKEQNPHIKLCIVFDREIVLASKAKKRSRYSMSVHKYNRMHKIVDRVWEDAKEEFNKYKGD